MWHLMFVNRGPGDVPVGESECHPLLEYSQNQSQILCPLSLGGYSGHRYLAGKPQPGRPYLKRDDQSVMLQQEVYTWLLLQHQSVFIIPAHLPVYEDACLTRATYNGIWSSFIGKLSSKQQREHWTSLKFPFCQ